MSWEEAMREALALAREAGERGEVPIGAVAVFEGRIVGRGANGREGARDPTAHFGVSLDPTPRRSSRARNFFVSPCSMKSQGSRSSTPASRRT